MMKKSQKQKGVLQAKTRFSENGTSPPLETTKKRENRVAKELGAQAQPASGATPWAKEDMKDEHFLYQHKQLEDDTKGHRVTVKDLEALRHHAIDDGLEPCYIIEYQGKRWYMISDYDFNILRGTLRRMEDGD